VDGDEKVRVVEKENHDDEGDRNDDEERMFCARWGFGGQEPRAACRAARVFLTITKPQCRTAVLPPRMRPG
jgi:hypothetical protein